MSKKGTIILIEPMAHSLGHYLPYSLRLSLMLKKEYSRVILLTTEKIRDKNAKKLLIDNNIQNIYTNAQNQTSFKIMDAIRKKLPSFLRRMFLFDYLHYKAIKLALKKEELVEAKEIFFMNTSFYLPLLFLKLFNKDKKILVYRISYPYKSKVLKIVRKVLFNQQNIKLVFQNKKIQKEVIDDINLNSYVLPNLASTDAKYNKKIITKCDKIQYLFFGINHVGKDWKVFEDAVHLIDNEYLSKIKFLFVGDIKQNDQNCDSPYDFKLNNKIDIEIVDTTGRYISTDERNTYFGKSNYIVVSFKETFNLSSATLIDAISYNRPVIASENFEITTFVKKYKSGILFKASQKESLAIAIKKSIDNYNKYSQINYEDFMNEHSYDVIAKKVSKMYENI